MPVDNDSHVEKICRYCKHFNDLPGFKTTGICDVDEYNERAGVPVVLTGAEDTCWQWEKEISHV